jgi:hypothetical protein
VTTLPFGRHRSAPLGEVPTSYLAWLVRTVRLSSGVRAAVAAELARRGIDAPPPAPPAARPVPPCARCGAAGYSCGWQQTRDGRRQIHAACTRCGRWLGFLPQVEPHTGQADAAASAAPILDALTRLEALGVELAGDGRAVWFAGDDWRRVPADLQAVVRQCRHTLAGMLGDTRRKAAAS